MRDCETQGIARACFTVSTKIIGFFNYFFDADQNISKLKKVI